MKRLARSGLALVGGLCLLAGLAGAQAAAPLSTVGTGKVWFVSEYDVYAEDFAGTVRAITEGTNNLTGSYVCDVAYGSRYLRGTVPPAADVEGVCAPESAFISLYAYEPGKGECRRKDTGQSFTTTFDSAVTCFPASCFGTAPDPAASTPLIQVGCTYSIFFTSTENSALGEATTENVHHVTVDEVAWDANRGLVVMRASAALATTSTVTFTIPEEDRPARDVAIEVPAEAAAVSGVGIISGWSCLGGQLAAEFSDATGVIASVPLSHGASRADTASVCGDSGNGFSSTMNWTLLGAGEKTLRLMQNGEAVASRTFSVVAFDQEFISGARAMCTVDDFPAAGQRVTVEWDEPQQSFEITEIH